MRKWSLALLAGLALAGCATSPGPVGRVQLAADNPVRGLDAPALNRVRMAGPQMLFWPDQVRLARFREMERHFPGTVAAPAPVARQLPAGAGLAMPEGEVTAHMQAQNLVGLMVVQDGKVRLERYAHGFQPQMRWTSFSMAKSVTATLAGQALKEGYIRSLADPVTDYLPELKGSGYDGVTLEQVLTMSSGVRWNEDYADPASDVARMFSEPLRPGEDPALAYMAKRPRQVAPGIRWVYNTGETNLVGAVVQRATGKVLSAYAAEKLIPAAGFEGELFWMIDPAGSNIGGCCLSLTLRDYARFGLLALEGGRGVTGRGWFGQASAPHKSVGAPGYGYGYQWWSYPGRRWGALGIFGQAITLLPQHNAVVVQLGNWPRASDPALRRELEAFVVRIGGSL